MSTTQDFKNAPVGATATSRKGNIALKTGRRTFEWSIYDSLGNHCNTLSSDEMADHVSGGFTLNVATPATAREALDLAWELAHEVKEGRTIPSGTRYLEVTGSGLKEYRAQIDFEVVSWLVGAVRTLDPLPEPEPDWLDAPAVIAWSRWDDVRREKVWSKDDECYKSTDGEIANWFDLCYVTPLYPEGKKA